jgi:ribose/xylose/arabinose/galactoside ABC-type transport system permease subunit
LSYEGLRLLLKFATPLVFAALAQMCVMAIGEIDLGLGPFIALVTSIAVTLLFETPALGVASLIACIGGYCLLGAIIHLARVPSIVATLGASFIWFGLALMVLPTPGGTTPNWLAAITSWRPPVVPFSILLAVAAAVAGELFLTRTSYGVVLRGIGSNPAAVMRSGWSLLVGKVFMFGCASALGIIAGLLTAGLNTTGDPRFGSQFTLESVAAVIVGGGEFSGGIVSPAGAVLGAFIMLLTGSVLSFADVSPDWQLAAQGCLLILVLVLRRFFRETLQ